MDPTVINSNKHLPKSKLMSKKELKATKVSDNHQASPNHGLMPESIKKSIPPLMLSQIVNYQPTSTGET